MANDVPLAERYYVYGINGSTGRYLEDPLTPQQVGEVARKQVEMRSPAEITAAGAFPGGGAEMFQSEPAPADLFTRSLAMFAASEVSIHDIWQYLSGRVPITKEVDAEDVR